MKKDELRAKVQDVLGGFDVKVSKDKAGKIMDAIFQVLYDGLLEGKKITLGQVGTLETKERAARKGRNPQTGEEIEIAACKVAKFKAAKPLKEALKKM